MKKMIANILKSFERTESRLSARASHISMLAIGLAAFAIVGGAIHSAALAQAVQVNHNAGAGPDTPTGQDSYANRERYLERNRWAQKDWERDRASMQKRPGTENYIEAEPITAPMRQFMTTGTPVDSSGRNWLLHMEETAGTTQISPKNLGDLQDVYATPGFPITDTSAGILLNQALTRGLERSLDPERLHWNVAGAAGLATAGASNSSAYGGENSLNTLFERIVEADGSGALINVANEASGTGGNVGALFRTIPDAVGMVMQMYKHVYIPMAILFLLPGAVISQVKGIAARGLGSVVNAPEAMNPFDGIMRAIVAVFLIPGTQVIVSWSIDVGNSMAYSMRDWVDIPMIVNWCRELSYDPKPGNYDNTILPPNANPNYSGGGAGGGGASSGGSGGGTFAALGGSFLGSIGAYLGGLLDAALGGWFAPGEGIFMNMREGTVHMERQGFISIILQFAFNYMVWVAALFLVIMSALQITLICYLFLMGPLAAAFYAWPATGQRLFRGVFGNWVEAVIKVSLWRFFWMVILAVMTQRLIYTGGGTSDLQWEVCIFASFLGLLLYVPTEPFVFDPNGAFTAADRQYSAGMQQGRQAAGGGGGGGGGQGGGQGAAPGGSRGAGKSEEGGDEAESRNSTNVQGRQGNDSAEGNPNEAPVTRGLNITGNAGSEGKKDGRVEVAPPKVSGDQQGDNAGPNTGKPPGEAGGGGANANASGAGSLPPGQNAGGQAGKGDQGKMPVPLSPNSGAAKDKSSADVPLANAAGAGGQPDKGSSGPGAGSGSDSPPPQAGGNQNAAPGGKNGEAGKSDSSPQSVTVDASSGQVGASASATRTADLAGDKTVTDMQGKSGGSKEDKKDA
ncbi:MAG: hypothetical protein K2Y32_00750 [Candidatus Obscuribacterales bacterium]|nr:hypothetical protein [Candidatus Obscuribacterales bacterium]